MCIFFLRKGDEDLEWKKSGEWIINMIFVLILDLNY